MRVDATADPAGQTNPPLTIAVGVATSGRPLVLAGMLSHLRTQTRPADAVIVCASSAADITGVDCDQPGLSCIVSARGLTRQRNAILAAATEFNVLIFLDDDFVPCAGYLAAVEQIFRTTPAVVMGTGRIVADGIRGPGFGFEDALKALRDDKCTDASGPDIADVYSAYGCNMVVRVNAARAGDLSFDEALPLYGWLEDVDFSRRMAMHGRIVTISAARGVHLGVKSGRQSGRRLGYSQVSNPLYLVRKGTCTWSKALLLMSRNILANAVKALHPEPYIDRVGRLAGNLRALMDLVNGRLSPERAMKL